MSLRPWVQVSVIIQEAIFKGPTKHFSIQLSGKEDNAKCTNSAFQIVLLWEKYPIFDRNYRLHDCYWNDERWSAMRWFHRRLHHIISDFYARFSHICANRPELVMWACAGINLLWWRFVPKTKYSQIYVLTSVGGILISFNRELQLQFEYWHYVVCLNVCGLSVVQVYWDKTTDILKQQNFLTFGRVTLKAKFEKFPTLDRWLKIMCCGFWLPLQRYCTYTVSLKRCKSQCLWTRPWTVFAIICLILFLLWFNFTSLKVTVKVTVRSICIARLRKSL